MLSGSGDQGFTVMLEAALAGTVAGLLASRDPLNASDKLWTLPGLRLRSSAPCFPRAEQIRAAREGERAAVIGAVFEPLLQRVLISEVFSVASRTISGGASPVFCHSRQPSRHQRKIAGHSASSFSASLCRARPAGFPR